MISCGSAIETSFIALALALSLYTIVASHLWLTDAAKLKYVTSMRKSLIYAIMAIAAILGAGTAMACYPGQNAKDKEKKVERTHSIKAFTRLEVNGPIDIKFVQGKKASMRIVGKKSLADDVVVKQNGGTLTVSSKDHDFNTFNIEGVTIKQRDNRNVTIYLSTPNITDVTVADSGGFYADGNISGSKLNFNLNGSGDVRLHKVTCDRLSLNLRGSGDIDADEATCSSAALYVFGSGDLDTHNLKARNVDIQMKGSGDIDANLSSVDNTSIALLGSVDIDVEFANCGSADCMLRGSGDIELSGTLHSLSKSTTGTGDIDVSKLNVKRTRD